MIRTDIVIKPFTLFAANCVCTKLGDQVCMNLRVSVCMALSNHGGTVTIFSDEPVAHRGLSNQQPATINHPQERG